MPGGRALLIAVLLPSGAVMLANGLYAGLNQYPLDLSLANSRSDMIRVPL